MGVATLRVPTIFLAVDKMSGVIDNMSKKTKTFDEKLSKVANVATVSGIAVAGALGVALDSAIKFEDKLADVAKTTGLEGKGLENYGNTILNLAGTTRSSIDDLLKIGEIGGQLGIAKEQLGSFTVEANKFAVALGSDFSGGVESAVSQFAKLKNLFADTKGLDVSDSLNKSGSAFNALSSKGVNVEGLTDFSLRVGALPEAFRPSLVATAALGATLQKSGVDAQIASSGFSNFISTASQNLPLFAKQMGLTTKQAKDLINTDTATFFAKFAESMKGVKADQLGNKLKSFKLNSLEVQKAVGGMSSSLETYNEFMKISSGEFQSATSLTDEYNTKNETTAAKLEQVKNNMEAFSIVIGTQLIPLMSSLLSKVLPIISSFVNWAKESPNLAGTLLIVAGALLSVRYVIMLVKAGMFAYNVAVGIYNALFTRSLVLTNANNVAQKAYLITSKAALIVMNAWTWIQGVWTAATAGSTIAVTAFGVAVNIAIWPITLIVVAILAVIAIFYYWDEICAWFSEQWDKFTSWISELWDDIVSGISEFDFIGFFMDIGKSIFDFMITPLKEVLELIAEIPLIGGLAQDALDGIDAVSQSMDSSGRTPVLSNTNTASSSSAAESIVNQRNSIDLNINDKGGNVSSVQQKGPLGIPITTTPTWGN